MVEEQPVYRTGKICYLEIPAVDVDQSADFYVQAFGWRLRRRGDGAISFDDTVFEVSGSFVTGRPPTTEAGLVVSIMVADMTTALDAVRRAGGQIVFTSDPAEDEVYARFTDPAGNVLGLYQQPGLAEAEAAASKAAASKAAAASQEAQA